VVDIACVRKYPREELVDRAREHTKRCLLMGHCVESGYALVDRDRLVLLDDAATPQVVAAVHTLDSERGIRLRAERVLRDGEMRTTRVEQA
jgi:hypothetical protein